jgi:hypothetical protein
MKELISLYLTVAIISAFVFGSFQLAVVVALILILLELIDINPKT